MCTQIFQSQTENSREHDTEKEIEHKQGDKRWPAKALRHNKAHYDITCGKYRQQRMRRDKTHQERSYETACQHQHKKQDHVITCNRVCEAHFFMAIINKKCPRTTLRSHIEKLG